MVSPERKAIRENLMSRSSEIASRWFNGAIHDPERRKKTPDELKETFEVVVNETIEILTSETFGPSRAHELGERVSHLKPGSEDFIGRTQEILSFEMIKDISAKELRSFHNDLSSFMANFTTGYIHVARQDFMKEQKVIHDNLMKDLVLVDEKLRKTNEELEAKVEERTAELKRLNESLKKEIDIRTMAEESLKQRENLLSVVFDTSYLWTGLLDPDGRLILPNKPSLDFLGLKKEDVVGKHFWDTPWWSHSEELKNKVHDAIKIAKKGSPSTFDVFHVDPDGIRHEVQFSIRPVKNSKGEVIHLIPEGVDITIRKRVEKELRELNEVLRLINKIMRHDISNRLLVAHGNIGLMMEKGDYDPERLDAIENALRGSIALTKRMADLEKLIQGKEVMKEFDLSQIIEQIFKEHDIEPSIPRNATIMADDALVSVFNNLVSNAIGHGGATKVEFRIEEIEDHCSIRIYNDGTPIPKGARDMVFDESFSFGDSRGSGLGLFIAKKLIERYGGSIELVDTEDNETLFEIRLPRSSH